MNDNITKVSVIKPVPFDPDSISEGKEPQSPFVKEHFIEYGNLAIFDSDCELVGIIKLNGASSKEEIRALLLSSLLNSPEPE